MNLQCCKREKGKFNIRFSNSQNNLSLIVDSTSGYVPKFNSKKCIEVCD